MVRSVEIESPIVVLLTVPRAGVPIMTSNGKYSMKVNAPSTLPFVFLLLFTGQLVADEYQSIFDGKSLAGWRAPNMSYWSVRDGGIHRGQSLHGEPISGLAGRGSRRL